MSGELEILRAVILVAYQDGREFVATLPVVRNVPMHGWDGALQLQIVRHG